MTTIISSQRYLDDNIISEKIADIEQSDITEIVLKAWNVGAYDYAILGDGHHTFEAAQQCGINVRFEIIDHPERIYGDNLLEQAWMDSDWYDIETGQAAF